MMAMAAVGITGGAVANYAISKDTKSMTLPVLLGAAGIAVTGALHPACRMH